MKNISIDVYFIDKNGNIISNDIVEIDKIYSNIINEYIKYIDGTIQDKGNKNG